jgi:HSP20 family protein
MATIVRWNPVREVATVQDAMDRFFNDSWRANWRNWKQLAEDTEDARVLPLDVFENDATYTVIASLPGASAETIDVKFHEDFLTIKAEIPETESDDDENSKTLLRERFSGKLSRRVHLPQPVNVGTVEASYHNGVLKLVLPKAEEAQPRIIPVKVNGSQNQ